jgi:hypothetical protein
MIRIGGRVSGVQETVSAIGQIPSLLKQAGEGAMREVLELVSETLRKQYLEGPYPEEIQSRSGGFRSTFRREHAENIFEVRSQGTRITGTFGSKDKRGRILNDGGVVRSSRAGGLLAVRTEFTKTAGGVVRPKYRGPLRGLPNTFVRPIRAPRAKAAVFERIGKRIIPIAWLVASVFIKGRHFMEKAVAAVSPRVEEPFRRRFGEVINRFQQTLNRLGRGR